MIKLILYEWKKMWKNASILKIVLLFFFLSAFVFQGEINQDKEAHAVYLEFHENIKDMTNQEALQWIDEVKQKEDLEYGEYKALVYLEEDILAVSEYDAYREGIQSRYKQNQGISIFAKDGEQNHYMKKIAQKYEKLNVEAPMRIQPYQGFLKVVGFYVQYVLAIVFLIYLVSVVFVQEEKNGKADFSRTMCKGKQTLFFAKTCAIYGMLFLFLFVTFLINIILAGREYGFVSLKPAIQSVPGFHAVPYAWSIGIYLIAYLGLQALAALVLVAVAICLAKVFVSEIKMAIGLIIIVLWNVMGHVIISGDSAKDIFRIWNIWNAFTGKTIINNYEILRFGNIMIDQRWGIVLFVFVALLILFISAIYKSKEPRKKHRKRMKKGKVPHGLFYYEMKKMWIYQGAIFLFIACIGVQAITIWQHKSYIGTDEYYYQQYIDEFGKKIEKDTDIKISKEEKRLEELRIQLEQTTDFAQGFKLEHELECAGGFELYVQRVERLRNDKMDPILLKDQQYRLLFEETDASQMLIVLLYVSFAFLIPAAYQKEKETHVEHLQKTSWYGKRKLWSLKIETMLFYCIPFIILNAFMVFLKVNSTYHLEWKAPIRCLSQYWNHDIKMSVVQFWILGIVMQCFVATLMVVFLSACAKRAKNQHMLTGVMLGIMVVPIILSSYIPVVALKWIYHFQFVFTSKLKTVAIIYIVLSGITYLLMRREWKK